MGASSSPRSRRALLLALALLLTASALQQQPASAEKKPYVVYLGGHSHGRAGAALASSRARARRSHVELLGSVLRSEARARGAIFYSYTRYINGFAATLEDGEAAEVSRPPRVVSVFPNRGHRLHTTRSWEFLGLEEEGGRVRPGSLWAKARFGEGVVIGNLDTGVTIGSFHAAGHGVTVVCSAGNAGPAAGTVSNTAPWLLTVGASTMDREFPAYLVLDSKKRIKGRSLSPTRLPGNKYYQLISSEEAKGANATATQAKLCIEGSLDKAKVEGKIVVCIRGKNARVEKGEAVRRAGGVGLVLANDKASGNEMIADAHVLPATHITYTDGIALLVYLNSTR